MRHSEILRAWGSVLAGGKPFLSIEITRECPLRCPGCYAYEDDHLHGTPLRQLSDYRGEELVRRFLALVDKHRPLHVSIVGGDPLVRYRELNTLLPELARRGIDVQVVTSAFREIPAEWSALPKLRIAVSIDGLQPEHDARRKPATYARILENIAGQHITVHCTLTSHMMQRAGYLEEFVRFWSGQREVERIWMSMFTPQAGANDPEILSAEQRAAAMAEILRLRPLYPKLDMPEPLVREFARPPRRPEDCMFARTTLSVSADLKTKITPCQFGGTPDCSNCGCYASMGLAAVANHRLPVVGVKVMPLFKLSAAVGAMRTAAPPPETPPLRPNLVEIRAAIPARREIREAEE